ncbi:MAG: DUF3887 domain-containing protein, partial [Planctomycetales bacterium]
MKDSSPLMRCMAAFLALVLVFRVSSAEDPQSQRIQAAKNLVDCMRNGKFDAATDRFDAVMKAALPPSKLKELWDGLASRHGPLQQAARTRTESVKQYEIVYVTCEFAKATLDFKVVFSSKNEITGLFVAPSGSYRTPSYVDASLFHEKEITIGNGFLTLPGTLSLPQGKGTFPAVILVHGSGP